MSRRREMVASRRAITFVDYLESHGTEYIDTGVMANQLPIIGEIDYQFTGHQGSAESLSGTFGARNIACSNTVNPIYTQWGGDYVKFDAGRDTTTRHKVVSTITESTLNINLDGVEKSISTSNSGTDYTIKLYCKLNSSDASQTAFHVIARIWLAKYTVGGVLVRDFVPCVVNGVGYMYDKVSGTLFGNAASTGAFTWGEMSASANGGGYKLKCQRRSYRRSSRPSARFCALPRWEVAA